CSNTATKRPRSSPGLGRALSSASSVLPLMSFMDGPRTASPRPNVMDRTSTKLPSLPYLLAVVRLGDDTLADLDLIAAEYRKKQSLADAIRIVAKRLADSIRKKGEES